MLANSNFFTESEEKTVFINSQSQQTLMIHSIKTFDKQNKIQKRKTKICESHLK